MAKRRGQNYSDSYSNPFLLVFDLNCNLVAQYAMDKPFEVFIITPDDKYLYALGPAMEIIRYELPSLK